MNNVIKLKALSLSMYALRVFPAKTRLTVYRRRPVPGGDQMGPLRNLALKIIIIIIIIICSEIKNSP